MKKRNKKKKKDPVLRTFGFYRTQREAELSLTNKGSNTLESMSASTYKKLKVLKVKRRYVRWKPYALGFYQYK